MFLSFENILWVVMAATIVSVPGHFIRLRRYRCSGDRRLLLASIVVSAACGVWLGHDKLSNYVSELLLLSVEAVLWIAAAGALIVGFLVINVTHRHELRRRVHGLSVVDKALFSLGFASFGNPPISPPREGSSISKPQGAAKPLLIFGSLMMLITILAFAWGAWDLGAKLCAASIVLVAAGSIDAFVRWSRALEADAANDRRARDRVQCRNCGYLLRGLPEPRCPECGEAFPEDPHGDDDTSQGRQRPQETDKKTDRSWNW